MTVFASMLRNSLIPPEFSNEKVLKALKVSVRFFTSLREITGKREETISFSEGEKVTLDKLLKDLSSEYGKDFTYYVYDAKTGEVRGFLQFLINGKTAAKGLQTELEEGDVLAILPPVGGG